MNLALGSPAFPVNLAAENSSEVMGWERRKNFAVDDFSWTNPKHLIIIDYSYNVSTCEAWSATSFAT
jgi:hypothetical protein